MPQLTFDIPNNQATRIGNVLSDYGYVYDSGSLDTDAQQKIQFLKVITKEYWTKLVIDAEKNQAVSQATSESLARTQQIFDALQPIDLSDIT